MGQPTLPSPAASSDGFIIKSNRPGTPWYQPTPYPVPADIEKTLGPYWKMHPRGISPVSEMGLSPAKHQAAFLSPGQNVVQPLFPPGSDSLSDTYAKSPMDESSLARFTPEASPAASSRNLRHRRTASALSGADTPRSSSAPRTYPIRDRRAARKVKEQKRRDASKPSEKPLSQIAGENPEVLVPDAEAFANRPIDVRRREAAEAGKIKRPLNAFMLYRRSYQNIAKTKCLRNNHQQVSTVCGDSWKTSEPREIIDRFNLLAIVEKEMHEQAFPDYKYDPVLNKKAADVLVAPVLDSADSADTDYGVHQKPSKQAPRKRAPKPPRQIQPPQAIPDEPIKQEPVVTDVPAPDIYATAASKLPYFNQPVAGPAFAGPCDAPHLFYVDSGAMLNTCPATAPTTDPSHLAMPTTCVSGGVIDPRLFYVDTTYIDTALLINNYETFPEPADCGIPIGVKIEREDQSYQHAMIRKDDNLFLPDMDQNGTCNAYLRGTDEDWEVMPLDEGTQFQDWIAQTEAYGSWT